MIYILIVTAILIVVAIEIYNQLKVDNPDELHDAAAVVRTHDRERADFIDRWAYSSTWFKLKCLVEVFTKVQLEKLRRWWAR